MFALSGRGLPAGAWSRTANGIRSHSTYAGGGGHLHSLLQLTEDQAAAAGAAPLEAATTPAGKRLAAGEDGNGRAVFPSASLAAFATRSR